MTILLERYWLARYLLWVVQHRLQTSSYHSYRPLRDMTNPNNSKILQVDHFKMRPLLLSDLDTLASIWTDPEVTRFLPSQGKPISRENTEKTLRSLIDHWQQRGYGVWAIVENDSSQMMGYCGLRYLQELDEVEVLYGLAKPYWGRGIATQAAIAAVSYAFEMVKLDKIIAIALPDNLASTRVMEKAGLRYKKQIHIFNLDGVYYEIHNSKVRQ